MDHEPLARSRISTLQDRSKTHREIEQTRLLASIVERKFEHTDRVIELKRDGNDADAVALVRTNRAKSLMDEANVFLSGIIAAADDRQTASSVEQSAERPDASMGIAAWCDYHRRRRGNCHDSRHSQYASYRSVPRRA